MVLLLFMLYGLSTFSLTTVLLTYTQPFFLLGSRMTLAGIFLFLYAYGYKKERILKEHRAFYVQATMFALFLPYALRYYGLQYAIAPRAHFLYNLGPIITYFATYIAGVEKITKVRSCALSISCMGLLLTFYNQELFSQLVNTPWGWAELALLLSVISFSYGWIIIHKLITQFKYNPVLINGITMLGAGILGLGTAGIIETPPYVTSFYPFSLLLLTVVLVSNCIAHNLYAYLLKIYSLTLLQLGYWLIPVLSMAGHMIYAQTVPSISCAGALLCSSVGFWLFYTQENTYKYMSSSLRKRSIV